MKKSLVFSFSLIGQIGFATALPLVIFGLIGQKLDHKFGTAPYLFILGLLIATIQIFFYLRRIIKKAQKEFQNEE